MNLSGECKKVVEKKVDISSVFLFPLFRAVIVVRGGELKIFLSNFFLRFSQSSSPSSSYLGLTSIVLVALKNTAATTSAHMHNCWPPFKFRIPKKFNVGAHILREGQILADITLPFSFRLNLP